MSCWCPCDCGCEPGNTNCPIRPDGLCQDCADGRHEIPPVSLTRLKHLRIQHRSIAVQLEEVIFRIESDL